MRSAQDDVSVAIYRRRTGETAVTPNERAWIEFIRLASGDTDPPPTLSQIQKLRQIFQKSSTCR
ncbi:hypothetical protein X737_28980 [Mesorhizobium sp. L48C026A00]|nr:hypothetical protein X737_28980 [Mesorhizobium sp. L48C026A00]